MMKVDVVFILGPSDKFHPINAPKFTLPFLNVPLLNSSMNYLCPVASKIFIVCLEEHSLLASTMLKEYKIPIEVISTSSYEGMGYILNKLTKRITSDIFIMTKGDIYAQEPLIPLLEGFTLSNDDIYAIAERSNAQCPILCIDSQNKLVGTQEGKIPLIKNGKIKVTTELAMRDFYIIRTACLGQLDESLYRFKINVIPHLIKENKRIRIGEGQILQIKDFNDYVKQLDIKNTLLGCSDGTEYNLIDDTCEVEDGAHIENSIIGSNVKIGNNTILIRSIVMDFAEISNNRKYERCIVDSNNGIYKY